ncbi:MAG: YHYH protein [Flavobacteriales bacterium]|jgi:hypothetical protein|nr:YHYH protein [Flavobacteriales bacterium]
MSGRIALATCIASTSLAQAQTAPAITAWLQNTTVTGSYYMSGNSMAVPNGILVNCQLVEYSNDYVYVHASGVPAYPTGPYLIGPPGTVQDQNAIFKIPLNPEQNTGTAAPTLPEYCGILINGVGLWDFRDGFSWNSTTQTLDGPQGPGGGGPGGGTSDWNRDAVLVEKGNFDCSKAHPGNGNYHYHQNPTAFKLDLNVISTVCNLYDADGLYSMDSTQHAPLIGYAYDGFPIYGAFGYKNADGTGGIARMKSGYQLRDITTRTTSPMGASVGIGPDVSTMYPLGYFREDYEFITHPGQVDYLDEHNGRFAITPEYPTGNYCYYATVDANWNSAYPYAIGPTFYGVFADRKVPAVDEATTVYAAPVGIAETNGVVMHATVFPNPTNEFIAIQVTGLNKENLAIDLTDATGRVVKSTTLTKGMTIAYLDVQTLYAGNYFVKISGANGSTSERVIIAR